ncbi:MAG TPA: HlyD family type I secretion periplasmic adaptor subunit [Rhodocyclaceae bacterium]
MKNAPLSPEALDFAPGLLRIQESPPAKLPRTVAYVVMILFVLLIAWAVFGKLDIIASAEGRLVPQTYVKIVQPADAGIVQEILVHEGEKVAAGQVLMRMDTKMAQADQKTVEGELALRSLQLRRIDAELAGQPLVQADDDPPDLFRQVAAQYRDRRQAYEDALGQAKEGLRKAQREHAAALEVLAKLQETTPILKQQADAFADMGKDGFAPQVTVRDKQREYLEKSRELSAQHETVASLAASVAAAGRQVAQTTSRYRSELQNERIEAEGQHRKLQQEWVKQEHKTGLMELKAPQGGRVKDLATHTVGAVVSPGTVLLSLVPESEPLVAEVMVRNDDVGFVYAGQRVKVKLAPYPFQKYGMLDGTVIHVGPDAMEGNDSRAKDASGGEKAAATLAYKALVSLDSQTLEAQGERLKLVPGMQAVAEIAQGRRTVLEYVLSPVQRALHDSGRER